MGRISIADVDDDGGKQHPHEQKAAHTGHSSRSHQTACFSSLRPGGTPPQGSGQRLLGPGWTRPDAGAGVRSARRAPRSTDRTPMTSSAAGTSAGATLPSGSTHRRKPSWAASRTRQRRLGGRPDFPREPNLAEDDGVGVDRPVAQAGGDGREHGQVRRRLVDRHPAGHVHEHIVGCRELRPARLSSTARSSASRFWIQPARRSPGVAVAPPRSTSAWTSTRIGREPSIEHMHRRPRHVRRAARRETAARGSARGAARRRSSRIRPARSPRRTGSSRRARPGARGAARLRSTAPCRRRARAPSGRRDCRPSSRGRRARSGGSAPSP